MCDYSLHSVKSRPAKVGDKLTTRDFGTGTRGFAASEDPSVVVCVLPGTELAFAHEVKRLPTRWWSWHDESAIEYKTAIFRQINKDKVAAHHDALEFPNGQIVLLTFLCEGQQATVLQLPADSLWPPDLWVATRSNLYLNLWANVHAAAFTAVLTTIYRLISVAVIIIWIAMFVPSRLHARDDGRFTNSPLKEWFDRLASRNGLCCAFADGVSVQDVD
jgi:hypothetical protein